MESMIERVARAIAIDTENGDISLWPQFTSTARAAIEAMSEPTEGMMMAGYAAAPPFGDHNPYGAYTAMIDEALKETDGESQWKA